MDEVTKCPKCVAIMYDRDSKQRLLIIMDQKIIVDRCGECPLHAYEDPDNCCQFPTDGFINFEKMDDDSLFPLSCPLPKLCDLHELSPYLTKFYIITRYEMGNFLRSNSTVKHATEKRVRKREHIGCPNWVKANDHEDKYACLKGCDVCRS